MQRAHTRAGGDTYGRVRAVVTLDHATELVRHMLVLTLVVAAPVLVSLPFKLLMFVLVDGWRLITAGLIGSFVS